MFPQGLIGEFEYEFLFHATTRVKFGSLYDIVFCFVALKHFDLFRCLEEGAEDFLLKPVQLSDVSRLCNRVLR